MDSPRYKLATFTLKDNQVNYFPYYRNQTGNMEPHYLFEDDLRDQL